MSTYVVSPSASGIGSHERFLSVIEQEHIAIIGYAPDDGKADSFYAIKDGDLVIIARGANRNKECFFAGLADGDGWFVRVVKGEDYPEKYARKLRGFVDLRGLKVPFTTKCKGGESRNPHRTCTEIGGTDADDAVVKFVAALVEKTLFRESIMRYIEVLKRSKNLIFSGAPGTGKTYLARQIAQKMILGRVVDDETKLSNEECAKLADQMGFVQFHPSYDIRILSKDCGRFGPRTARRWVSSVRMVSSRSSAGVQRKRRTATSTLSTRSSSVTSPRIIPMRIHLNSRRTGRGLRSMSARIHVAA